VEFEIVIIVPTATLLPATAEQELPPAAAVVQETMELPTVQVVDDVDGVTLNISHVVETPE